MTAAIDDPLASASGQFPLAAPEDAPLAMDRPSPAGVRPWGLRFLRDTAGERGTWDRVGYDHERQVAVDQSGRPLVDHLAAGPSTADTTSSVDGEDPPSSEDWKNDFYPDEPYQP